MKKSTLPIPEKYGFDDTPKAFKRMMQQKSSIFGFKKNKSDEPSASLVLKRNTSANQSISSKSVHLATQPTHHHSIQATDKAPVADKASLASGFKTIRSKRKVHLQSRDLKKKLKKFDSQTDNFVSQTSRARDVRDVVQEPPKLHQPKKAFKKIKDDREELKSWSDEDNELE